VGNSLPSLVKRVAPQGLVICLRSNQLGGFEKNGADRLAGQNHVKIMSIFVL